jgi:two-component system, NarL family, nitrate/nitrite response regulator NarL
VVIAAEHAVVTTGIRYLLLGRDGATRGVSATGSAGSAGAGGAASRDGIVVLGETRTPVATLRVARNTRPHAVIVAVRAAGDHENAWTDAIAQLAREVPRTRVVLLNVDADDPARPFVTARLAVSAVLPLSADAEALRAAVVGAGVVASNGVSTPVHLTLRERQILAHVAAGQTSREIAAVLRIAPRTVHTHRENLMRKLGASSVAGMIRYALEHDLTDQMS